ncbi:MAG: DUF302 domain-containing protein [Beijerinckiaceae bacterium]
MRTHMLACAAALSVLITAGQASAQDMTTTKSANDFAATKTKLVDSAKAKGFAIVAEVDHSAAAKASNLELRPTHLVIFGNPRGGTPLMGCNQTAGIDLPLKALIWQAADGAVNVTVNTPSLLAGRHKIAECGAGPLGNVGKALEGIVADATK